MPITNGKTRITAWIGNEELIKQFKLLCIAQNKSLSKVVEEMLEQYLRQHKDEIPKLG